jgi:hypothetical protein
MIEQKNAHSVPRPSVVNRVMPFALRRLAHVSLSQPQNNHDEPDKSSDERKRLCDVPRQGQTAHMHQQQQVDTDRTGEDDDDNDEPSLKTIGIPEQLDR